MPTITRHALESMLIGFRLHLASDKAGHETGWLLMGKSEHVETVIGPGPNAKSCSSHVEFDKPWQIEQAQRLPRGLQAIGTVHSHPLTFRQMSNQDLLGSANENPTAKLGEGGHSKWVKNFGPGIFGLIFADLSFQWYVLEPGKEYRRVEMEVVG